jgi:hypothetical protein
VRKISARSAGTTDDEDAGMFDQSVRVTMAEIIAHMVTKGGMAIDRGTSPSYPCMRSFRSWSPDTDTGTQFGKPTASSWRLQMMALMAPLQGRSSSAQRWIVGHRH